MVFIRSTANLKRRSVTVLQLYYYVNIYAGLERTHIFQQVALENLGTKNASANGFLAGLGQKISAISGEEGWNLLSVPANFRSDTAFQRYPAARELCWWEPLGWLTIRVIISSINFCLPPRELLPRLKNDNNKSRLHTYSNAFLSCYNASTPCFCTTLCQLTCRTYDNPTIWF